MKSTWKRVCAVAASAAMAIASLAAGVTSANADTPAKVTDEATLHSRPRTNPSWTAWLDRL